MKYPDLTRQVLLALCSKMELKDLPYWDGEDFGRLADQVNDLAIEIADVFGDLQEMVSGE